MVVMGTDGLFDNVFDRDMKPCLVREIEKQENGKFLIKSPQMAAECLGDKAYRLSKNRRYESPFSVNARIQAGRTRLGGKEDDITVIVAQARL